MFLTFQIDSITLWPVLDAFINFIYRRKSHNDDVKMLNVKILNRLKQYEDWNKKENHKIIRNHREGKICEKSFRWKLLIAVSTSSVLSAACVKEMSLIFDININRIIDAPNCWFWELVWHLGTCRASKPSTKWRTSRTKGVTPKIFRMLTSPRMKSTVSQKAKMKRTIMLSPCA